MRGDNSTRQRLGGLYFMDVAHSIGSTTTDHCASRSKMLRSIPSLVCACLLILLVVMATACGARETVRADAPHRDVGIQRRHVVIDGSDPAPLFKPAPYVDCTSPCETYGRCIARDGRCFLPAASDAVCAEPKRVGGLRLPSVCEEHGECHAQNGACRATTDGDCETSQDCAEHGLCHFDAGLCIATAMACVASRYCKKWGHCTHDRGRCTPTPADCAAHSNCKEFGWCDVNAGDCEARDEADCAASASCMRSGDCHLLVYPNGRKTCAPRSAADCAASENCQKRGWCELIGERCDKPESSPR